MAENFDEIVTGVVKMVDKHTSDPNIRVSVEREQKSERQARGRSSEALRSPDMKWSPTAADWKLIEEAALLPEAELIET